MSLWDTTCATPNWWIHEFRKWLQSGTQKKPSLIGQKMGCGSPLPIRGPVGRRMPTTLGPSFFLSQIELASRAGKTSCFCRICFFPTSPRINQANLSSKLRSHAGETHIVFSHVRLVYVKPSFMCESEFVAQTGVAKICLINWTRLVYSFFFRVLGTPRYQPRVNRWAHRTSVAPIALRRIRVDVDPKHNLRRSLEVPEPQHRQYNLPYPEQTRNFHIINSWF